MNSFPVKLSIKQILELTKQFPKEIKTLLIRKWMEEIEQESADLKSIDLSIEGYDEPIDLNKAAFTEEMLEPLEKLWEDEISAEELVEMLTK